tara:strand:+ start:704 stop:1729 length:1026 start_codon:yes stop_codon:yes gene_type:complete
MLINCNDEWESFCINGTTDIGINNTTETKTIFNHTDINVPKSSKLYISTTTKISYLSSAIDIFDIFWKIPIVPYNSLTSGVVKKQIKYSFTSKEDVDKIIKQLENYEISNLQQISFFNSSDKKIYKDIRKINIGVCEKDVLSCRSKAKSAFYNCFVVILRIFDKEVNKFKEAHVKVFNTGKLELPGIKSDNFHNNILETLTNILNTYCNLNITYKDNHETVLINSNFSCGYCLNREKLANILRSKYNIETAYDPCSYPGIMSKIIIKNSNKKISFMVFRTGSILIVGKCTKENINDLYNKLILIFNDEYKNIMIEKDTFIYKNKVKSKINNIRKKCYTIYK